MCHALSGARDMRSSNITWECKMAERFGHCVNLKSLLKGKPLKIVTLQKKKIHKQADGWTGRGRWWHGARDFSITLLCQLLRCRRYYAQDTPISMVHNALFAGRPICGRKNQCQKANKIEATAFIYNTFEWREIKIKGNQNAVNDMS